VPEELRGSDSSDSDNYTTGADPTEGVPFSLADLESRFRMHDISATLFCTGFRVREW
jgi:hypothetical protein